MQDMFSLEFLKKYPIDLSQELPEYNKSLVKLRKLVKRGGSIKTQRNLYNCLTDIGTNCEALNYLPEALENYGEAYELALTLFRSGGGTRRDRFNVAKSLFSYARVAGKAGERELALKYFTETLKIFRQLASESDSISAWRYLSINLYYAGIFLSCLDRMDEAYEKAEEAFQIAKKLFEKKETYEVCYCLAHAMNLMGDILVDQNQPDKALEIYTDLVDINRKLIEMGDLLDDKEFLDLTLSNMADIVERKEPEEALEYFPEVIRRYRQRASDTDDDVDWIKLCDQISNYSIALRETEKIPEALDLIDEGLSILDSIDKEKAIEFDDVTHFTICYEVLAGNRKLFNDELKRRNKSLLKVLRKHFKKD